MRHTKSDIIDTENMFMLIHRTNLDKYLKQYFCKTEEDLETTLWYNYGYSVKIVD